MRVTSKRKVKLKAPDYAMLSFASFYIESGTNYRLDKWLRVRPPKEGNPKITACRVVGELLTWAAKNECLDSADWVTIGVKKEANLILCSPAESNINKEFAAWVLELYATHNVSLLAYTTGAAEVGAMLTRTAEDLLFGRTSEGAF